ncbi:33 kDa protein [Bovine adenovirus 3]|uniref:33 kDa protein n=1 Tax=Bovine adenovirus B serotype 3 TaxID=10510 RepID=A0A9W3NKE7_ADEB3|nr:33 kDa protein [Bovine adenovirus 3]
MKPRSMSGTGPSAAQASEGQQPPLQTAGLQASKRAVRKVVASLNPTAALEDISEGEEDFPLTDEEDGDTLESDFSDFTDEDAEEEDMISTPRDQGHSGELEEGEIPATEAATAAKKGQGKKSRWDQQVRSTAPLKGARGKRSYSSWKPLKPTILSCLLQSSGSTAFTRRYLLFRHGVSVPSRVIHYYNSYCRPEADQNRHSEQKEPPECQRGAPSHSSSSSQAFSGTSPPQRSAPSGRRRKHRRPRQAAGANLSHSLCHIPTKSSSAVSPQSEK